MGTGDLVALVVGDFSFGRTGVIPVFSRRFLHPSSATFPFAQSGERGTGAKTHQSPCF